MTKKILGVVAIGRSIGTVFLGLCTSVLVLSAGTASAQTLGQFIGDKELGKGNVDGSAQCSRCDLDKAEYLRRSPEPTRPIIEKPIIEKPAPDAAPRGGGGRGMVLSA